MFYMLARVQYQIGAGEELSLPHGFCSILPDLPYRMQKVAALF
jgi:hypothetical protein